MYKSFYGFTEKPFSILPDSDFLYLSRNHEMALSYIEYGLSFQAGFIVLTGEVGSGKTTLLNYLMHTLDEGRNRTAFIFNTLVSPKQFLVSLVTELEQDCTGSGKAALNETLNDFLLEQYRNHTRVIVMIDEAQNLPFKTLEEIRMLSNLSDEKVPLLHILFSAQPNFNTTLNLPEMEQMRQRVAVHFHLEPMDLEDTCRYIDHRLRKVNATCPAIFTPPALQQIYRESGGIPRVINLICDTALVHAYADQQKPISQSTIEQVVHERKKMGLDFTSAALSPKTTVAPLDDDLLKKILSTGRNPTSPLAAETVRQEPLEKPEQPETPPVSDTEPLAAEPEPIPSPLQSPASQAEPEPIPAPQQIPASPAEPNKATKEIRQRLSRVLERLTSQGNSFIAGLAKRPIIKGAFGAGILLALLLSYYLFGLMLPSQEKTLPIPTAVTENVRPPKKAIPASAGETSEPSPAKALEPGEKLKTYSVVSQSSFQSKGTYAPESAVFVTLETGQQKAFIQQGSKGQSTLLSETAVDNELGPGVYLLAQTGATTGFIFRNRILYRAPSGPISPVLWKAIFKEQTVEQKIIPLVVMPAAHITDPPSPEKIKNLVTEWAEAWTTKDIERFMGFYAKRFELYGWKYDKPLTFTRAGLRQHKTDIFERSGEIELTISDPFCAVDPGDPTRALALFHQTYRSALLTDEGEKVLFFSWKEEEGTSAAWKITGELFLPEK
jgi:general secretion pathway protein A